MQFNKEAHLSELFKITISYVRELRRSMLNAQKQQQNTIRKLDNPVAHRINNPLLYRRSLTSYESLDLTDKIQPAKSTSSELPDSAGKDKPWFSTFSLVKSLSSSSSCMGKKKSRKMMINQMSNDFISEDKLLSKQQLDYYDDDNFSISDNLNLFKNDSYSSDLPIEK